MNRISETAAHLALRNYYQTICDGVIAGYRNSIDDGNAVVYSRRTSACTANDLILAELTNRLDGFAELLEDKRRNLRFLKYGKRRTVLLWVKKVNPSRQYSLVKTSMEDRTAHAELIASGQAELLPSAAVLTIGYLPTTSGTRIRKVCITPTHRRGQLPAWWIDLAIIPSVPQISAGQNFRVEVRCSSQQRSLVA